MDTVDLQKLSAKKLRNQFSIEAEDNTEIV